jgi:antitoxin (DNA-binding transcriptional repressor) of toxin-antitoxin stability system
VSVHAFELHGDEPADLEQLADAASSGEVICLTRDGERIAAVVPVDAADALEHAEDAWLAELAAESLAEEGESVPLEQVKAELGL